MTPLHAAAVFLVSVGVLPGIDPTSAVGESPSTYESLLILSIPYGLQLKSFFGYAIAAVFPSASFPLVGHAARDG